MSTRFEGCVAFVTGGARGIGRATVERLAGEGAKVAFCDVDADVGEQAALYRLDADALSRIRTITIGNGTDWDVERGRMYHVDSTTQQIDVFDYDVTTGDVENVRRWASIDPDDGLPDGLTIDSEGCVWLALFQGGAVRRFDPDGKVMYDIAMPTPFVTCPAFGGDDLATLFVTSSQHRIPREERALNPMAGAIFTITTDTSGRPANQIAPEVAGMVIG